MTRTALTLAAIALASLAFTLVAPASADQAPLTQYAAQAQAILSTVPVTYVGADWGPVPIYRVDLTSAGINETIDVAAPNAAAALADAGVLGLVERALWDAAGDPPLQTTTTTPTTTTVTSAAQSATVTPPTTTTSSNAAAAAASPVAPAAPDVTTTPAAATSTTTTAAAPSLEQASNSFPSGTVYVTRQVATVSATLSKTLAKAIGLPVTFAPTAKFTLSGKTVTASALRTALRHSHSVKLALTVRNHHFVVLSITA